MKVKDLARMMADEVEDGNGDLEVRFAYPSGDYWKTVIAAEVEHADTAEVKFSKYHEKDEVIEDDGEDDEEEGGDGEATEKETTTVLLLTS
jgi:hypothetical protein